MPLLVHVDELQPRMRLAEPFMWHGRMMLTSGKIITRDDIDILKRKYPDVTLKIGDPVLDTVADFEDDSQDRKIAHETQQVIAKSLAKVQERFASRTSLATVNFESIKNSAVSVIEYLKDHPVTAALLQRSNDPKNYLADHAGSVFYLAMVLGSAVRDYVIRERMRQTAASGLSAHIAMDLLPLGLGAMFIDVGMHELHRIYVPGYKLTDADRQAIRQHPLTGADLLPDTLPAGVKTVVRAHHENFDGSGYPGSLPGHTLHIFTRIVRICDAFEAATAQRIYSTAKSPARVIWEMCSGPFARCYDPVLLKVFKGLIQPFPIGAKLKLADGRYAVVVRYNRRQPFQPSAIVAFDANNKRLEREKLQGPLNLGEDNPLRIASFNGEDLSFIYDLEVQDATLPPPGAFHTPLDAAFP